MTIVDRIVRFLIIKAGKEEVLGKLESSKVRLGSDGLELLIRRGEREYVVRNYHVFLIRKVPRDMNVPAQLMKKFKGISFSLFYDFELERVYLVSVGAKRSFVEGIFKSIPGFEFEHLKEPVDEDIEAKTLWRYVAFPMPVENADSPDFKGSIPLLSSYYYKKDALADLYHAVRGDRAKLLISFVPASEAELQEEKRHCAEVLRSGGKGRRGSPNTPLFAGAQRGMAALVQADAKDASAAGSEAVSSHHMVRIAKTIIAMCENAKLMDDAAFRVVFNGWGEDAHMLEMHLASKFPSLKQPVKLGEELVYGVPQKGGDVMSGLFASNFVYFPEDYGSNLKGVKGFKREAEK